MKLATTVFKQEVCSRNMGSLPNLSILRGATNPIKPNLIHRLFEETSENNPDCTAIIYNDTKELKTCTYNDLNNTANKISRCILDIIKKGDLPANSDGDFIIAVCMQPSDALVLALLAVWKSGAAYLPIDAAFPKIRVEHIITESKPVLVIHDNGFDIAAKVTAITFEELLEDSKKFSNQNIESNDCLKHQRDNLAIVLYTSGSTGEPKGVRLPHEIIFNRLQWQFKVFPYSVSERIGIFNTSLTFVDSICELWGPLLSGRAILVVPKIITQNPEKFVALLEDYKIERLVLVPSLLSSLLLFLNLQNHNQQLALSNLKICVCSGETLRVILAQEFFKYFPENEHILCNFYGSTEVMGDVTYHVISGPEQLKNYEKVPIGLPIDNTIIYLLDEDLKAVETGSVGELWVSGLNLAAGYVNRRDPDRFITNPYQPMSLEYGKLYKTGDYAKIEKGALLYEGRTDSQVKVRGHRVDLSEVEKVVNSLLVVEKGVVLCHRPGDVDQALLAFVALSKNNQMGSLPNLSILRGATTPLKPNLIHRLFEETSENNPNSTAVIYNDTKELKTCTYNDLNNTANKISRCILDIIKKGDLPANSDGDFIIAVCMQPSDALVLALLAVWKSGAAYLPIDAAFPKNRMEHIITESKPVLVIHDNGFNFANKVTAKAFTELLEESKKFSNQNIETNDCLKHQRDNLAIVLYTSGSTGEPKGVRLPHEIILNRLQWQFKIFPYSVSERTGIFKTSLTFGDSICELWGPLLSGRAILVVPKKITQNPEKFVGLLEDYKIERLVLVPSLLRSLLLFLNMQKNNQELVLSNLKLCVCSGETLTVFLAEEFFKYFPENKHVLCNFYGSTEVMADVAYHVISGPEQLKTYEKVPIGIPIDNTIIYLLDEDLKAVETGSVGELWVSGLNLAAGYVNRRDPDRFITNPYQPMSLEYGKLYKTGDYAKIEKGALLYEGRTDSQVKVRGHRVDLSEVEKVVNSLLVVEKGVVLCHRPGDVDQALLAFVALSKNNHMNVLHIEHMLHKKLTSYMWPQIISKIVMKGRVGESNYTHYFRPPVVIGITGVNKTNSFKHCIKVIILESIPLLTNGKIDQQTLLKIYKETYNSDINCCGVPDHQMTAAKVLLETISSILNHSARGVINIYANFYEIGGNSLNSILTISKLKEQGYYISIGDFIGANNLREILNYMSTERDILSTKLNSKKYTSEMLKDEHKDEVLQMITKNFYVQADLEQCQCQCLCLMCGIYPDDYKDWLDKIWDALLDQNISFVAKTDAGKTVGVSLNLDARDEPEIEINTKLSVVFEFLEFVEGPVRDKELPEGKGKIFHSSMMTTNSCLDSKENIFVMQFLEEEVLRIARSKHFAGIFTTNTSPLTQQLGINVYGYQTMSDVQVNKYVASDGSMPFTETPDSQRAIVCWKPI